MSPEVNLPAFCSSFFLTMQRYRPLLVEALLRLLTVVMKRIRIEPQSQNYGDNRIIVDQAIWNDDNFFKEIVVELKKIRREFLPRMFGPLGYPTFEKVLQEAHIPPPVIEKSAIEDFMSQMDDEYNPSNYKSPDKPSTTNFFG